MVVGSVLKTHTSLNLLERSDDLVIVCNVDNLPLAYCIGQKWEMAGNKLSRFPEVRGKLMWHSDSAIEERLKVRLSNTS